MPDFQSFYNTLDADPGKRAKQFEVACKWFLENDPAYALQLNKVWLWDDWPGRWGIDAGIDIVAEDKSGKLWAVQCKAYDAATPLKKADLDSFLSESSRPEFSYRLLIATTDLLGRTAERTFNAQEKPAGRLLLSDLKAAPVQWPKSFNTLRPTRPKAKKPRSHQKKATKDALAGFETHDRGQLIMACGTGKTVASMTIAKETEAKRILVLAPSISLLRDTIGEWTANFGEFSFIPVCSDSTVDPSAGVDSAVETVSQLGYPVTTDPAEIAKFLRRRSDAPLVVFSTYQSSPRVAEAFAVGRVPKFDLALCDEAHRCAGPVSSDFATILDAKAIPSRKRLFMTATPRYFTGRVTKAAKEADYEVASMDDEEKFGPVFHQLSFSSAIEKGLLSDYQVIVIGVSDDEYREWAESGRFVTTDGKKVTDARALAGQIGLLKAMKKFDLRRVISFHSRVAQARKFADSLVEVNAWLPKKEQPAGELWGTYVSGDMSAGERSTRLDRLRQVGPGERGLLANARCLSEGIDVPSLDGVAFIDPRRSEVDIIQAVGRAIRLSPDKTLGTIVVPVFLGAGEDAAETLESSAFKPVWDVVRALRAHDDSLAGELDTLRRERGRLGSSAAGEAQEISKVELVLPEGVGVEFAKAFDVAVVDRATENIEMWFGLLEAFATREGHSRVPKKHIENGRRLGATISKWRTRYNKNTLPREAIIRLENHPGWTWDPRADDTELRFAALDSFVAREGHAQVPVGHIEDGFALGSAMSTVRGSYRKETLAQETISRLETYPGWTWDSFAEKVEEHLRKLDAYVAREGHARVPQDHIESGSKLGQTVVVWRSRHRKGILAPTLALRLQSYPGWTWDPLADAYLHNLQRKFEALDSFVAREGHSRVPDKHVEDGLKLGSAVGEWRMKYRASKLAPEIVLRLQSYPGWTWNPRGEDKARHLELLLSALNAFMAREGHSRVPRGHIEDGFKLGSAINSVRAQYRSDTLPPEAVTILESLPGWTWGTSRRNDAES